MLGRRGPVQAAFTPPELKELGELARRRRRSSTRPISSSIRRASAELEADRERVRRNVDLLREYAARPPAGRPRRIVLRFLVSPVAIVGEERVEGVEIVRNELVVENGRIVARPTGRDRGHPGRARPAQRRLQGRRAPGRPVRRATGVIPNDGGRVAGRRAHLRRRLDQARPERRHRHEQEGRDRDGRAAARPTLGPGSSSGARWRSRAAALGERGVRHVELRRLAGDRRGRARGRRAARPAARQAADVGGSARRRRGTVQLVTDTAQRSELWGGETTKAIANFPVSGEPIPVHVARWLGRIKAAAARVNGELGLLDADKAERIAAAADRDRGRRARRPVPDRRLPDRLRHLVEHERERGDRGPRRRGRACERRRQHGPELERRLSLGRPSRRPRRRRSTTFCRRSRSFEAGARGRRPRSSPTSSSPGARTGWTRCP